MEMDWRWTWAWTLPVPASFGDNPIADWLRVICLMAGVILIMWIGRVLIESTRRTEPMPSGQFSRFLALALADLSISGTEIQVVGTAATPRLFVNIVCLVLGAYGVRSMRKKQADQPLRSDCQ